MSPPFFIRKYYLRDVNSYEKELMKIHAICVIRRSQTRFTAAIHTVFILDTWILVLSNIYPKSFLQTSIKLQLP